MNKVCRHCGAEFNQAGRGAPRSWCYDCLPAYAAEDGRRYHARASRLATFLRTGTHQACCGIRPEVTQERRIERADSVRPAECLYCDQPLATPSGYACPAHIDHHRGVMARAYRMSDRGRAIRNENKARRRMSTAERLRMVIRLLGQDGLDCKLCGEPLDTENPADITIDHKVPIVHGGAHHRSNFQLAHHTCNAEKSDALTWVFNDDGARL